MSKHSSMDTICPKCGEWVDADFDGEPHNHLCREKPVNTRVFDYDFRDSEGNVAPKEMIGQRFKHSGNGFVYTVIGVVYNGGTDLWEILHNRPDCNVLCARTIRNFHGERGNGETRFTRIS